MKIRETANRSKSAFADRTKGASGRMVDASGRAFGDLLHDNQYKAIEEELADLLEDVKEQGQRLANRMNLEDLIVYKKMVSLFMNKAVHGMLQLQKLDSFDRYGKHNIYALIKKVNQKLEQLTQEILDTQRDQLTVLSHIDDIRGLLMDMKL